MVDRGLVVTFAFVQLKSLGTQLKVMWYRHSSWAEVRDIHDNELSNSHLDNGIEPHDRRPILPWLFDRSSAPESCPTTWQPRFHPHAVANLEFGTMMAYCLRKLAPPHAHSPDLRLPIE